MSDTVFWLAMIAFWVAFVLVTVVLPGWLAGDPKHSARRNDRILSDHLNYWSMPRSQWPRREP